MKRTKSTNSSPETSDLEDACPGFVARDDKRPWSSSSDEERVETNDSSDNDSGFMGSSNKRSSDEESTEKRCAEGEKGGCPLASRVGRASLAEEAFESENPSNVKEMIKVLYEAHTTSFPGAKDQRLSLERERWITEKLQNISPSCPKSLTHLLLGAFVKGDCDRPATQKPDWLDMDKLRRGQKFAQDHMFPVYFAELLSLFALFTFDDGLKPLIITGKSSTPYAAFKRYLSTGLRIRNWYTDDIWDPKTAGAKDIARTRVMHAAVRKRLETSTNEEIDAAAKIPDPWSTRVEVLREDFHESCPKSDEYTCPYVVFRHSEHRPKGINQLEMALTQCGFIGLITLYPKQLGVHSATDDDIEAFCHLWRSIGYQLGMEDRFNFCRGTLAEIRERIHDYLHGWVKPNLRDVPPEWEHMMRCVFSGLAHFLPGQTFDSSLLFFTDLLDIKTPRLTKSVSWRDWFTYHLTKSLFQFTIKLPGMASFCNSIVHQALDRGTNFTPKELAKIKATIYPGAPNFVEAS